MGLNNVRGLEISRTTHYLTAITLLVCSQAQPLKTIRRHSEEHRICRHNLLQYYKRDPASRPHSSTWKYKGWVELTFLEYVLFDCREPKTAQHSPRWNFPCIERALYIYTSPASWQMVAWCHVVSSMLRHYRQMTLWLWSKQYKKSASRARFEDHLLPKILHKYSSAFPTGQQPRAIYQLFGLIYPDMIWTLAGDLDHVPIHSFSMSAIPCRQQGRDLELYFALSIPPVRLPYGTRWAEGPSTPCFACFESSCISVHINSDTPRAGTIAFYITSWRRTSESSNRGY